MKPMKTIVASVTALLVAATAFAQLSKSDINKLNEATTVLSEIRNAPDNGIPDSVWSKAHCVVVIPDLKKAGFIVGGEHGSGVMSCKNANTWGPPVFMELTKGSAGLQAGVSSTDLVLVVMNESGADKLLRNKVTLGADASVAAGPVGRAASAATDAQLSARDAVLFALEGPLRRHRSVRRQLESGQLQERACIRTERVGAGHRSGTDARSR